LALEAGIPQEIVTRGRCSTWRNRIECVKFCKRRSWIYRLSGFAKVGFLVLSEVVYVEVTMSFEPVFVGFDG
jgi:hypothetical protein